MPARPDGPAGAVAHSPARARPPRPPKKWSGRRLVLLLQAACRTGTCRDRSDAVTSQAGRCRAPREGPVDDRRDPRLGDHPVRPRGDGRARATGPAVRRVPGRRIYFANHSSHGDFVLIWTVLPPALRQATRPVAAADYWLKGAIRRYCGERLFRAVLIDRTPATPRPIRSPSWRRRSRRAPPSSFSRRAPATRPAKGCCRSAAGSITSPGQCADRMRAGLDRQPQSGHAERRVLAGATPVFGVLRGAAETARGRGKAGVPGAGRRARSSPSRPRIGGRRMSVDVQATPASSPAWSARSPWRRSSASRSTPLLAAGPLRRRRTSTPGSRRGGPWWS